MTVAGGSCVHPCREETLREKGGEGLSEETLLLGGHPTGGAHEGNCRQELHPAGLGKLKRSSSSGKGGDGGDLDWPCRYCIHYFGRVGLHSFAAPVVLLGQLWAFAGWQLIPDFLLLADGFKVEVAWLLQCQSIGGATGSDPHGEEFDWGSTESWWGA